MVRWKNEVPSREALRAAKKEAVLREASIFFNKRGFHGTSLDDVARKLGVTKAALYYYFPNKQAVLKACHDLLINAAIGNLEVAEKMSGTGLDKLTYCVSNFLEYLVDDMSVSVMIMEEDALSPEDVEAVKRQRDIFENGLRKFVVQGIEDASIVLCDPKLAVFMILGAVNWTTRWYDSDGVWSSKALSVSVSEMLTRMLSNKPKKALIPDVGKLLSS